MEKLEDKQLISDMISEIISEVYDQAMEYDTARTNKLKDLIENINIGSTFEKK